MEGIHTEEVYGKRCRHISAVVEHSWEVGLGRVLETLLGNRWLRPTCYRVMSYNVDQLFQQDGILLSRDEMVK